MPVRNENYSIVLSVDLSWNGTTGPTRLSEQYCHFERLRLDSLHTRAPWNRTDF